MKAFSMMMLCFDYPVTPGTRCITTVVALLLVSISAVTSLNNGLALTPQMGWNSWNHFGCDGYNYTTLQQTAIAMVNEGLLAAGYSYLNVDDCWAHPFRTSKNELTWDTNKFPGNNSLPNLIDFVHSLGMKFGIYADAGIRTCARHNPGTLHHEYLDALTFASWTVDYLKYDNCYHLGIPAEVRYPVMRDALLSVDRPIFFSLCEWGREDVSTWGRAIGNSWRTTKDISDKWESMLSNIYANNECAEYGGIGGWNDPDMLEVGNGGMTTTEYISHFSLWCITKAPLIIGCDVTNMTDDTKNILLNSEAILINQDPRGIQGKLMKKYTLTTEVWAGPLVNDDVAVLLLNKGRNTTEITMEWGDVGLSPTASYSIRDLWAHQTLGNFTHSFTASVESHGVSFLRFSLLFPTRG